VPAEAVTEFAMNAFPKIFTIIDTETTGMRPPMSRIIDLGIIRVENGKVVERYQTFLNPVTSVPPMIERLTNISTEDIQDAPQFEEVALKVQELFKDSIFVAHNVSFDYRFVQSEFRRIGMDFTMPTLCTVKLSRALYPKERSHNLDALMVRHNLSCESRHRALPDADVLEQFIRKVSKKFPSEVIQEKVANIVQGGSRATSLDRAEFGNLPEGAGVYFFYGEDDELLYIGKSKHVKSRARSHFAKSSELKERHLQKGTTSIETISTSGELSALLLESALIKKENPVHNRALRQRRLLILAKRVRDEQGYDRLTLTRSEELNADTDILGVFRTMTHAKEKLRTIAKENRLCTKLLGVENSAAGCFGSQIQACDGACTGKMAPEEYNKRLEESFANRRMRTWPYSGTVLITEQETEDSGTVFFVRDWVLIGSFRYDGEDCSELPLTEHNFEYDIYKILVRFMLNPKNKRAIKVLSDTEFKREYARCSGTYEKAVI
jgi:DNA polymerase-3 subunit epsilon